MKISPMNNISKKITPPLPPEILFNHKSLCGIFAISHEPIAPATDHYVRFLQRPLYIFGGYKRGSRLAIQNTDLSLSHTQNPDALVVV